MPQQAQQIFWTAKVFHGYISKEYQIQCSYETVVCFFHKQGYALKAPQRWPGKGDEQLPKTFLKEFKQMIDQSDVDIWFADESGFEGDPRPRKGWDKKVRKTRVTKNGGHLRINVIGMVYPSSRLPKTILLQLINRSNIIVGCCNIRVECNLRSGDAMHPSWRLQVAAIRKFGQPKNVFDLMMQSYNFLPIFE